MNHNELWADKILWNDIFWLWDLTDKKTPEQDIYSTITGVWLELDALITFRKNQHNELPILLQDYKKEILDEWLAINKNKTIILSAKLAQLNTYNLFNILTSKELESFLASSRQNTLKNIVEHFFTDIFWEPKNSGLDSVIIRGKNKVHRLLINMYFDKLDRQNLDLLIMQISPKLFYEYLKNHYILINRKEKVPKFNSFKVQLELQSLEQKKELLTSLIESKLQLEKTNKKIESLTDFSNL